MTPTLLMLEGPDLLIILLIAILLFGGTRLAGVGKSAGRAIREFKEETSEIHEEHKAQGPGAVTSTTTTVVTSTPSTQSGASVVDAEVVEETRRA